MFMMVESSTGLKFSVNKHVACEILQRSHLSVPYTLLVLLGVRVTGAVGWSLSQHALAE